MNSMEEDLLPMQASFQSVTKRQPFLVSGDYTPIYFIYLSYVSILILCSFTISINCTFYTITSFQKR